VSTYVRKGRYPKLQKNSVRSRVLDLLQTFDGDWFTIRGLRVEYSARFGPVKLATLRRAVQTELNSDECEVWVRVRSDLGSQRVLEMSWAVPIEEDEE
jgi:hypothetical protein